MKKLHLLLLYFYLFMNIGTAQWTEINIPPPLILSGVDFVNEDVGYVAGDLGVFKTMNGGNDWEVVYFATNFLINLQDLYVFDENEVIVVGFDSDIDQSFILKTYDGGNNWQQISVASTAHLRSIFFISSNVGFCVGKQGTILKTTDAGETWQEKNSGLANGISLNSVYFIDEMNGFAVAGTISTSGARIIKTEDGGETWSELDSPTDFTLTSVFFINLEVGYIVSSHGEIFKTINSGDSWITQSGATNLGNFEIVFTDENTGIVVGGINGIAKIQKTINGGNNWIDETPSSVDDALYGLCVTPGNSWYAVGAQGTVLKKSSGTTNVNTTLTASKFQAYPNPLNGILHFSFESDFNDKKIKIYGSNGKLLKSLNISCSQCEIDVSDIRSNFIIVEVQTEKEYWVEKFIIIKK